jgi:hypothetical protein
MDLELDSDVRAVAEFMQSRIATERLVAVARGVAELAPILWGKYPAESIEVLSLGWDQERAIYSAT